jgi:hypothetical protein
LTAFKPQLWHLLSPSVRRRNSMMSDRSEIVKFDSIRYVEMGGVFLLCRLKAESCAALPKSR